MTSIIHPSYFPSISHFVVIIQSRSIIFEIEDNFQKQTNRNRTYIYSPNGIQLLNIPVKHSKENHQKTKDIQIETAFGWQKQHFKSLESAYRSSPYFEFFEDEINPIFEKKYKFLIDLNFDTIEFVLKCLRLKLNYITSTQYFHTIHSNDSTDFRMLINGKKDNSNFEFYNQVFSNKHGFLNNLSILDLLFNEGKYAIEYLKNQKNSIY